MRAAVQILKFEPGWVDKATPGQRFKLIRGDGLAERTSRKSIREHGELFTVEQVAEKLKCHPLTVYDYIKHGDSRGRRLGFFKFSRTYRISEQHLAEFVEP